MKNKLSGLIATLALSLGFFTTANAALIDRGNGMIYDTDQNITWLQDASYAQTSGYGGRMNWSEATAWADSLSYGGYDDWRLFNADPDPACVGYNCMGNELGHLLYVDLGRPVDFGYGSTWGPFRNIQYFVYWSGTESAPNSNYASIFLIDIGYQVDDYAKSGEFYAWAVRDGDVAVASVPEPGTLLLLAAGLAGIAGVKRRRC